MNTEETEFRTNVLLAMQRALWGMVTLDLRAVAVGWRSEIRARFIYDCPISPSIWDIVREVETYVLADFSDEIVTKFFPESRLIPEKLEFEPPEEWWAYVRREEVPQDFS